jgi:hypothetical protein
MQILFAVETSSQAPLWVVVVVALLVAWVVWGIIPSRKSQSPDRFKKVLAERDYETGVVVGLLGGDIQDAAVARYAQSRREADGHTTTLEDVVISSAVSVNTEE